MAFNDAALIAVLRHRALLLTTRATQDNSASRSSSSSNNSQSLTTTTALAVRKRNENSNDYNTHYAKIRNSNKNRNNNNSHVLVGSEEFRTISNSIKRDLMTMNIRRTDYPLSRERAIENGKRIANLASPKEPTYVITGYNGTELIDRVLVDLGWRRLQDKTSDEFKLKWVEGRAGINYESFKEGEQMVNRIPNCYLLTNKLGLLTSLQRYEHVWTVLNLTRIVKLKASEFLPETYRLDDALEQKKFFETYKQGEIWICKPTGMNQGRGIFLVRDLEDLQVGEGSADESKKPQRPMADRIVQRYVMNPLLLDGKKFDIRVYMLIASTTPFLVLYHKGYARLCLNDYKCCADSLSAHLTNQFIQKRETNYEFFKENTVWSFEKLNNYINKQFAGRKGVEIDWVYKTLTNRMKSIMLYCFHAVKHKLKARLGYFDLYGLDFLVDEDMKVWLIEVNANPCLATNCQALKEVVPGVVQEAIYLSIECFEKSRRSMPLTPLQTLVNYEVLYNGSSTGSTTIPRLIAASSGSTVRRITTSWPVNPSAGTAGPDDVVNTDNLNLPLDMRHRSMSIFHDTNYDQYDDGTQNYSGSQPLSMFDLRTDLTKGLGTVSAVQSAAAGRGSSASIPRPPRGTFGPPTTISISEIASNGGSLNVSNVSNSSNEKNTTADTTSSSDTIVGISVGSQTDAANNAAAASQDKTGAAAAADEPLPPTVVLAAAATPHEAKSVKDIEMPAGMGVGENADKTGRGVEPKQSSRTYLGTRIGGTRNKNATDNKARRDTTKLLQAVVKQLEDTTAAESETAAGTTKQSSDEANAAIPKKTSSEKQTNVRSPYAVMPKIPPPPPLSVFANGRTLLDYYSSRPTGVGVGTLTVNPSMTERLDAGAPRRPRVTMNFFPSIESDPGRFPGYVTTAAAASITGVRPTLSEIKRPSSAFEKAKEAYKSMKATKKQPQQQPTTGGAAAAGAGKLRSSPSKIGRANGGEKSTGQVLAGDQKLAKAAATAGTVTSAKTSHQKLTVAKTKPDEAHTSADTSSHKQPPAAAAAASTAPVTIPRRVLTWTLQSATAENGSKSGRTHKPALNEVLLNSSRGSTPRSFHERYGTHPDNAVGGTVLTDEAIQRLAEQPSVWTVSGQSTDDMRFSLVAVNRRETRADDKDWGQFTVVNHSQKSA